MSPPVEVRSAVVPTLTVPVNSRLVPEAVNDPPTVVVSKVRSLTSTRVALPVAVVTTAPTKSLPALSRMTSPVAFRVVVPVT